MLCDAATLPDPEATTIDLLAGDDTLTVDSGTYGGGFTGGSGVKTVLLNGGVIAGYTNTIGTSSITFSPASTATVTGAIVTGGGQDLFEIDSGTVSGAVSQGNGIDTFIMRGGSIGSLAQGDSRDIFFMSGGTIVGAFEDGDVATMTDGTIGRVDMKLDKNIFDMSGGSIIGNLVTGFDDDQIFVSAGSIGGNISVSGGNDIVQITGGAVSGEVRMSTGNDNFLWQGGGTITGLIDMGPDNDLVTLRNLADGTIAPTQAITGGTGVDALVLAGFGPTVLDAGSITSFETLSKTEPGLWTLGGSLTDITSATVYAGTLRLTGTNGGYGGSMTVAPAGTLEGAASALTPSILTDGIVRFTQGVDETYAGTIAGSGAVEKVGVGTVALTTSNTYAGGTTISEGTLQLGTGGTSGSIVGSVDIGAGGTFAFNRSDDVLWGGAISGTGNLVQIGPGRLDLAGGAGNGFTGDLYVQGGIFGMVAGATLAPANTYVGQALSGAAGAGTLLLATGAVLTTPGDFIVGPVAGSTGTVVIGGLEGTAPVAPGAINTPTLQFGPGDGRLVFNHSSNGYQFDLQAPQTGVGTIAGDGEIDVLAGRTILNAAHAGFGGISTISGGALQVNGILGGTVDVLAGGRLEGNGFVGPTSNAGTVAPGTSIGTLTILGDYVGAGGILETEVVLGDDASPTDLLAITGASTGTTRVDVINFGGQGALTDQGIRIVRVDGASPGAFTLIPDTIAPTGEAAVIGGAFVYGLYQGSPAAPADGDWYLRTIVNPPVVVPPLPPVDPDLP
ncbi:autotransporter outer membrane beta-barrel domain-containing protein, partial [Aureimonas altamirensis]|uniref:autotransporter outer membrane beta-barrel domain-containing protein n=2 Tax=Aureimonas altamirensis TaxID=370622 RepID=UPI001160F8EF